MALKKTIGTVRVFRDNRGNAFDSQGNPLTLDSHGNVVVSDAARQAATKRRCVSCHAVFEATKTKNGGLRSTCSPKCRLQALRRFIAGLQAQCDALAAEIAEEEKQDAPKVTDQALI